MTIKWYNYIWYPYYFFNVDADLIKVIVLLILVYPFLFFVFMTKSHDGVMSVKDFSQYYPKHYAIVCLYSIIFLIALICFIFFLIIKFIVDVLIAIIQGIRWLFLFLIIMIHYLTTIKLRQFQDYVYKCHQYALKSISK